MRIPSRFRAGAGVISPAGRTVAALAVVSALIGWRLGWREALWTSAASAVVFLVAAAFMIGSGRVSGDLDVDPPRVVVGEFSAGSVTLRPLRAGSLGLRAELTVGSTTEVFSAGSLRRASEHVEEFVLPTTRRQILQIGPLTQVRGDPLGLMRRTAVLAPAQNLYVHPVTSRLENLGAGFLRDLEGQPTADLSNSDVAFHALREYQPGDDRRFVHSRTSARVGKLMIRQFVDTRRSHLAIVLDTRSDGYSDPDEFELAVSLAASLGRRALIDEQDLTVLTGAGALASLDGQRLLDGFAGVEMSVSGDDLPDLTGRLQRSSGVSITAVVTGSECPISRIQSSARRIDPSVRALVVRAHLGGETTARMLGSATVLTIGSLDDFQRSLWKAAQW